MDNIPRFISLVLLTAYAISAPAQQSAPASAKASFTMNISLQKETVKAGAPVDLRIDLTNTSDYEIELYRAKWGHHFYTIKVLDGGKNAPALTTFGKDLRRDPSKRNGDNSFIIMDDGFFLPIAPGQTRQDGLSLNSEFDLSQPGVYTIQLERTDTATKVVVKSNTVTLIVTK